MRIGDKQVPVWPLPLDLLFADAHDDDPETKRASALARDQRDAVELD